MKKLKVMVVVGTRPEIIRLSEVIKKIDRFFNLVLVHTGQNYDYTLNEIFFKDLELKELKETIIIPGRAFVHDKKAEKILCRDGIDRIVARGPDKLSVDGEMSSTLSQQDVLKTELIAFQDLIEAINFFGVRKK